MTDETFHVYVSGRVQGVFFRASAQSEARRLQLRGWVRNRSDGRVEVVAAGRSRALAAFRAWLESGPPRARVESVVDGESPDEVAEPDFEVR